MRSLGGQARVRIGPWTLVGAATLLLACGPSETPAAQPTPPARAAATAPSAPDPAAALAEAQEIFATRCFACHGPGGAGDGPGSASLTPKPRNFQDATWQASVSDEHIANVVLYGGAAVGRSPTMPGNPDLIAKAPVVTALVAYIRGLARR